MSVKTSKPKGSLSGNNLKQVNQGKLKNQDKPPLPCPLADFVGGKNIDGIPYTLTDYFELVDWTGRAVRKKGKGNISNKTPKILEKSGLDSEKWIKVVSQYSDNFYSHIGSETQLRAICNQSGRRMAGRDSHQPGII